MKKIILFFSILFLWTCGGGGGDKATGPEEPPIVINLTSLGGQAQKGPFNNGTSINVAELTSALSPTGRNFSSAITDNSGKFSVANVQLESPYVELRANGFYFNEVSNEISDAQLTLYALSNLTGKTSINVNILTHLEKNRMANLIGNPDNPKAFAAAKLQAQEEVFAIFDYSRANVPESELLDISQGGAANGKLLAISAIIQGDLTVGQMSELLANISTDIASDGTLDDASLRATLINNSQNLDMAQIRANLVARYASLGISATIPDFETEINQFLKPPVVQDIGLSIDEDTTIDITLTGSDPEGESITFSLVDNSNNATVTLNGNVASYTPNTHFNGTDTFTYKANDGTSDSNLGTVTITVNAIDDDPNTNNVSATTDEDTPVDISLTADEYDGQNYSFSIVADPSNGIVNLSGSTINYTPNQDWNGTDTFTFEATDDRTARRNVATATITVNAINDAPASSEVSGSSDEDTAIDIALSATDVDQDNLTYSIVSDVSNGTTSISGSTLTYTPNQDWNGTDTFTYKVNDGTVDSNTSNGTITIVAVNDAPLANDMNVSTSENKMMQLNITLDATDIDGDDLTYSIINNVSKGSTSLNNGVVTYVPNQDFHGADGFTYKANDGSIDSNTATVVIGITPVNDAPSVDNMSVETQEDMPVSFQFSYTEVDNDNLTFIAIDNPTDGTLVINGAIATYTPNNNFNGTDTFTYKANDGSLDSNIGIIALTINSVNDLPVVSAVTSSTNEDVTIAGITLDGTDSDGDTLTYSIVTGPANGTVAFITSSVITYSPIANWNGTEIFTYKANDGTSSSSVANITITVAPINDAPVTSNIFHVTDEDTATSISLLGSDIEGSSLTFSNSNASHGTVSLSGSTITYTPTFNYNGTDSFSYTVNDGTIDSNASTVQIAVNSIQDVPIFTNVSYEYKYGEDEYTTSPKIYELDDVDGDGDAITWTLANQSGDGIFSISENDLVYTNTDLTHDSATTESATIYGTDSFGNRGPDGRLTINYIGGPQGLLSIQEYDPDWYDTLTDANTLAGAQGLRDASVAYYPGASSLGKTEFIVENRAGLANAPSFSRDYDRFDYWTATSNFDIEINFSETTLAWEYLGTHEVNGTVPFAAYAINNFTNERIRLYAGYWDKDGSKTWNVSGEWTGPSTSKNSYEPIYLFWPKDKTNTYNPANDSQYINDNNLGTSGGCGWASGNPDGTVCGSAYGVGIRYPFMTATLFVKFTSDAQLPTAIGHSEFGSGYPTGSAIIFDTYFDKAESSRQRSFNMINNNKKEIQSYDFTPEQ